MFFPIRQSNYPIPGNGFSNIGYHASQNEELQTRNTPNTFRKRTKRSRHKPETRNNKERTTNKQRSFLKTRNHKHTHRHGQTRCIKNTFCGTRRANYARCELFSDKSKYGSRAKRNINNGTHI
jgi:hypothetical protein